MMTVIISILHYNSNTDTINCLKTLMNSQLGSIHLRTIVLDNGSKERLIINEKDYEKIGLEVIVGKENLGFTGGAFHYFFQVTTGTGGGINVSKPGSEIEKLYSFVKQDGNMSFFLLVICHRLAIKSKAPDFEDL